MIVYSVTHKVVKEDFSTTTTRFEIRAPFTMPTQAIERAEDLTWDEFPTALRVSLISCTPIKESFDNK